MYKLFYFSAFFSFSLIIYKFICHIQSDKEDQNWSHVQPLQFRDLSDLQIESKMAQLKMHLENLVRKLLQLEEDYNKQMTTDDLNEEDISSY